MMQAFETSVRPVIRPSETSMQHRETSLMLRPSLNKKRRILYTLGGIQDPLGDALVIRPAAGESKKGNVNLVGHRC